ncbi:hypothetical protein SECTIM467_112 [Brevibacillus phage SecTim467]|uniref:RNA ligase domain-containing protein n=2 Tax=Jenstvirus jenst TaxID=1982225 RepID=A0A0K2CNU9_9CAUD|nr:RNA ligase [Brevibacillus phage Jenst]ALA07236.1 putative RNA ligase [Brevibacillus phage Jenst]ALA07451.1 hypothetical protein SECTIM467_112 [Brevibacillus phage SecTim467]
MSNQKKYMSITRFGHRSTEGVLQDGDYVVVFEKLDGANASFKRGAGGALECFSRNTKLDESNNLRGFYQWAHKNIDPDDLMPNRIYFGEWLVQHKVQYGVNKNQFYLFDVYQEKSDVYMDFPMVVIEAFELNLQLAPVLYAGLYQGFDHLMRFVGRSALADNPTGGEGIVVKNYSYRTPFGDKEQMFVKLVSEAFAEVQPQKLPRDPVKQPPEALFLSNYVTKARVEKLLLKLIDAGVVSPNFGVEEMGTILKNLNILDDIMAEEGMYYCEVEPFNDKVALRYLGKTVAPLVKEIIKERESIA